MRSRFDFVSVVLCMIGPSLVMGTFAIFTLWALPWVNEFGIPRRQVMLIYLLTGLLGTLLLPFVGRLIVRFTPWKLMLTGGLCMGGGLLATRFITSFELLAVVYAISIASGLLLCGPVVAQSIAVRRFPDHAGTIGGMMMLGWALSASLIPIVVTPILTAEGWRVALPLIGCTVLVVIPVICWTVLRSGSIASSQPAPASVSQVPRKPLTTRQLLTTWQFWVILATLLPMDIVQVGVMQNLVPYLTDLGVAPAVAGYVLSAKAMGLAVGALVVGALADRIDPRIVWSSASSLSILSLLAIATAPPIPLVCACLIMVGIAAGGIVPLIAVLLVRAFGSEGYPPAYGLFCLFMLPSQLGPFAAAWVRDASGTYRALFLFGAAFIGIGVVAVWNFKGGARPTQNITGE